MQHKTRRVWRPRDRGEAGSCGSDGEGGCPGDLHRRGQCPETASDGILAIGDRPARVRLADGAADGIDAAGARAAAAGDLIKALENSANA